MLARISALSVLALCASATTLPRTDTQQCNPGTIQCCNSIKKSSDPGLGALAALIGLTNLTDLVGLKCNPLNVVGIGGNSCTSQAACCTGNTFSGLITLGCSPINLNL